MSGQRTAGLYELKWDAGKCWDGQGREGEEEKMTGSVGFFHAEVIIGRWACLLDWDWDGVYLRQARRQVTGWDLDVSAVFLCLD